jgi:hypothetical protein
MATNRMTRAVRDRLLRLVDTRTEHQEEARDVAAAREWLDKAMDLYGRRRVEAAMRTFGRGSDAVDVQAWRIYRKRVRAGEPHMVPWLLVSNPFYVGDNIAFSLVFAPRAA